MTAWGDSRTTGYQTRGGYAVTKDATGVWRYAVRLDAAGRPVPSALEVGDAEPPAAARDLRAKVTARRRRARAGERSTDGASTGARARAPASSPPWSSSSRSPTRPASAPPRTSGHRTSSAPAARCPATTRPTASAGSPWCRPPRAAARRTTASSAGSSSPTTTPTSAATSTPPRPSSASTPSRPPTPTSTTGPSTPTTTAVLSVSELHVTVIVAGYETSYGGELDVCGNSVWGHQGGLYKAAPKLDGTIVNRRGGTMFGEWMCTPSSAPGQMSSIGDDGARARPRHRLPRPLRHRLLQRRSLALERDVERWLEPRRHRLLRHHAGRARRVLQVLPGLGDPDAGRRRRSTARRCPRRRPARRRTGSATTPTASTGSSRPAAAAASTSSSRTASWSAGTPACRRAGWSSTTSTRA